MIKQLTSLSIALSVTACSLLPHNTGYNEPKNLLFQNNTKDTFRIYVQRDDKLCADDTLDKQNCQIKFYIDDFKAGDFYINNQANYYLKENKYKLSVKNCTTECQVNEIYFCVNEQLKNNEINLSVDANGKPFIINKDGTNINTCPKDSSNNSIIDTPKNTLDNINLAADSLFKFNGSQLTDLLPAGKKSLTELAEKITSGYASVENIKLTGHTDRLGSEQYNQQLALKRALTVQQYLIAQGIPAEKLSHQSAGESQPVTQGCFDVVDRTLLKACLQADRRVTVEISGIKKP